VATVNGDEVQGAQEAQAMDVAVSVNLSLLGEGPGTIDPAGGDLGDGDPDQPLVAIDPAGGDLGDGDPDQPLAAIDPAGGDLGDGDPDQPQPITSPTGGDLGDGDPDRRQPAMRPTGGGFRAGDPDQQLVGRAATASRLVGAGKSARLVRVPAQVLVVRRQGARSQTAAHYVLLGPIPGEP
jgi:hypothetical protein